MNGKRWAVALALPVGLAIGTPIATAQTTTVPAPAGVVDAVAVQVTGLLALSHTRASATPSGAGTTATANVVEVGGKPPLAALGGTQVGPGTSQGKLLDTSDIAKSLPVRVEVAPWSAAVHDAGGCRTAGSRAALARVTLVDDKTAKLNVLQSEGSASHCDSTLSSASRGSTDGATIALGGQLFLDLLHSESASNAKGHTYVASIAGNELLNNDQIGRACALVIPNVADLTCLVTGGGLGTVFSSLADLGIGGGALGGKVSAVSAGFGSGTLTDVARAGLPAATLAERSPAARAGQGHLAFTGLDVEVLALVAVGLAGLGVVLLSLERRRAAVV